MAGQALSMVVSTSYMLDIIIIIYVSIAQNSTWLIADIQ